MLTLRYNEPMFILMLRGRVGCLRQHELLNRLRSTMAVNVLRLNPTRTSKIPQSPLTAESMQFKKKSVQTCSPWIIILSGHKAILQMSQWGGKVNAEGIL